VFLDLEVDANSQVILVVGNQGDAPARTIRFVLEDRIPWSSEKDRRPLDLPAFRDGIPYLAPKRILRFHLGHLDWKAATEKGGWLKAQIHFKGETGEEIERDAYINLARYDGVTVDTFETPEDKIAMYMKEFYYLASNVDQRISIASGSHTWCPACSKQIPDSAKKCYQCGEWLPERNAAAPSL
jgi:hypothetical protein